ncbi:uncharacterized protein F4807DRAFT_431736, partial [Annulohypoxylon truncatum]|uniref:uncharacterized protein n=1 Tax=Annulohypoxylon truncatum TaxID=327061 RepID=UPI002008A61C
MIGDSMTFSHLYEHNVNPQASSRHDLPEYCATFPFLVSALDGLTMMLTQHIEHYLSLFTYCIPGADLQEVRSQGEELSSAERIKLGKLYTAFSKETQTSEICSRDCKGS